jgi:hypothetical protein
MIETKKSSNTLCYTNITLKKEIDVITPDIKKQSLV